MLEGRIGEVAITTVRAEMAELQRDVGPNWVVVALAVDGIYRVYRKGEGS